MSDPECDYCHCNEIERDSIKINKFSLTEAVTINLTEEHALLKLSLLNQLDQTLQKNIIDWTEESPLIQEPEHDYYGESLGEPKIADNLAGKALQAIQDLDLLTWAVTYCQIEYGSSLSVPGLFKPTKATLLENVDVYSLANRDRPKNPSNYPEGITTPPIIVRHANLNKPDMPLNGQPIDTHNHANCRFHIIDGHHRGYRKLCGLSAILLEE